MNKKGFTVPNEQERAKAVGDLSQQTPAMRRVLTTIASYFLPIPYPGPNDWLANHSEGGQSYDLFSKETHRRINGQCRTILIMPLDLDIPKQFTELLGNYCRAFFLGATVEMGESCDLQTMGVPNRINSGSNQIQFDADVILKRLFKHRQKHVFCVVGLTMRDLYPCEEWNFVFGMACLFKRTGVFSFARYDERFFKGKPYKVDHNRLLFSTLQVMVHEIGHMFGVEHCIYFSCVMNGANNLEESKKQPLELCPMCLRKMQLSLKFDATQRYCKLLECLQGEHSDPAILQTRRMLTEIVESLLKEPQETGAN